MSVYVNDVTFSSFGKPFQEKIIQALLSDHSWAQQMMEVLRPEYFEVNYLRYAFELIAEHYGTFKLFPSITVLATMVRDRLRDTELNSILREQVTDYLMRMRSNPAINDLPWIKDRSLNFCKNQALKEALEEAVDLTKEQRYEEIVERIKRAITVGTPNTAGHDFFEDFEARFVKSERHVVPTGMGILDSKDYMNGGLGKGEIAVIIAPTGVGKSHFLVQLGCNAMRAGMKVLHYTFELSEAKIGNRYDSNFCGISATDVPDEKDFIKDKYAEMGGRLGRLIIKEYPTNTASVQTLRAHIEKIAITKGFRPDVLIVDYADVMRSSRQYDSLRHELKLVYEELRGLGMELGIPVWTASQSNRDSTESDIVGLDKISESFGKAMVCDFIVTLSRKPLQKAKGLGNLFIAKNRLGKDGIVFPVKVDTARSIIEVLDKSIDLEEFQKTYENDQKQILKERWNEVANDRMLELRKVDRAQDSEEVVIPKIVRAVNSDDDSE